MHSFFLDALTSLDFTFSVTNSSSGLIFEESWRNPGGFLAKIRSSFCDLVHIQSVVDLFAKQLYNALNMPKKHT